MLMRNWTEWWSYSSSSSSFDDSFHNETTCSTGEIESSSENGDGTVTATTTTTKLPKVVSDSMYTSQRRLLLLDIRPYNEYQQRNLVSLINYYNYNNADSAREPQLVYVHIPIDEVLHRKFELPPRQNPFAVLSSFQEDDFSSHWENIQTVLLSSTSGSSKPKNSSTKKNGTTTNNSSITHPNDNTMDATTIPSRHPSWNVIALFNANNELFWDMVTAQYGCNDVTAVIRNHHQPTISNPSLPLPRLWSPDPMIEYVLLPLLKEKVRFIQQQQKQHVNTMMEVWDIGSGLGRDVCFLAEELLYNTLQQDTSSHNHTTNKTFTMQSESLFRIIGYDQRYRQLDTTSSSHSNDTIEFWKRRHVANVTECYCCDMNQCPTNIESLQRRSRGTSIANTTIRPFIGCIYAVRYWNKTFFQTLIDAGCRNVDNNDVSSSNNSNFVLETGTIIAISHFGKASVNAGWDFPHPKAQHVLERDELRLMFTNTAAGTTIKPMPQQEQSQISNEINHFKNVLPRQRSWKILHDQVVCDSDYGRTLIQFVAQLE